MDEDDLPSSLTERAATLERILVIRATGGMQADDGAYKTLRLEFMRNAATKPLLPEFVRTCRSLDAFWPYIRDKAGKYAERRRIINDAFTPLVEHLEEKNVAPADKLVSDKLESFDAEGVHTVWTKAVARRASDSEGAITVARTLLETVCKRILDDVAVAYTDKEDLPKLYAIAARALNLAPDQHIEEPIRAILGGAMNVVNGLGTLRNRFSDSHGRGGKPVKPSARHASLAVNMAGAMAMFLVETNAERKRAGVEAKAAVDEARVLPDA